MSDHRITLRAWALLGVLLVSSPALAGSGGPDAFGYTWHDINDPTGCAILEDAIPTDNQSNFVSYVVGPIDLGFAFPFYDRVVTQVWFHQAGLVFFEEPPRLNLFDNQDIPRSDGLAAFVAPYWSFLANAVPNVAWETDPDNGVFRVFFNYARPQTGTLPLRFEVYLFRSGDIRIEYLEPSNGTTMTIGMEGPNEGTQSLKMRYNGTQLGGLTYGVPDPFAICIDRPNHLSCAAAQPIDCNSTTNGSSPASIPDNAEQWGCGSGTWSGKESVYSIDVPALSDLEVSLTGTGARTMAAYLLRSCDEWDCIAGGSASFEALGVPAGTYYIAVDAQTALDEGSFTLDVACSALSEPLFCEDSLTDTTSGQPNRFDAYPCVAGDFGGAEDFYTVDFVPPGPLSVSVSSGTGQGAFILDADQPFAPEACLAGGVGGAVLWDPPAGTYMVVVDGPPGGDGGYTISVGCGVAMSCAGAGTIACQETVSGSTVGLVPRVDFYRCSAQPYDGPEAVYEFTLDATDTVSFVLDSADPGLDVILLDACDEGACLAAGDSVVSKLLAPGTYYVVVDGRSGASGDFTLSVICGFGLEPEVLTITSAEGECFTETKRAWLTPEMVKADILMAIDLTGSMGGVRSQVIANMNDLIDRLGTFIVDPAFALASHKDYAGSFNTAGACSFSSSYGGMGDYAYQLHQPMTTDRAVIEGAVASLPAASGGGDLPEAYSRLLHEAVNDPGIAWRPNTRRLIVAFGDNLPHDCNVLECLGEVGEPLGIDPGRDEIVGTADDLLFADVVQGLIDNDTALLRLTNTYATMGAHTYAEIWDCWSESTGGDSAQLEADGRVPSGLDLAELIAELVRTRGTTCSELQLVAEPGYEDWVESATPVYADVQLPASVEFEITFCVPVGTPPGPYDFVVRLMCGDQIVTTQQVHVDVTEECDTTYAAPPEDVTIVAGDTTTLDASGMILVNCEGANLYEWRDGRGTTVGSTAAVDVAPVASDTYTVGLTCSVNPLCQAERSVDVTVEQRPQMQGVVDHCWSDLGLHLGWAAATFPSGSGVYNVYRSEISPADALLRPPVNAPGLAETTYVDTRTRIGRRYVYVVQAEDAATAVAARPPGPNHGGVVSLVSAEAGPILAVQAPTPDLLGWSLRVRHAGHEVTLDWTGARALLTGEHFHVLKGTDPSVLAMVNAESQLTTSWTETDRSAPLQFFDVRIADACENQSLDDEPPSWDR